MATAFARLHGRRTRRYFVYSLESSGGHSAWHSPVQYFSRARNKIVSLDDALNDAVMNPQFLLSAPDNVTTLSAIPP